MAMVCPECGDKLPSGAERCSCGWVAPQRTRRQLRDAEHWRCSWVADGERCHYPGSISPSTRGEGPWFCAAHFSCRDGAEGAQIVEQSKRNKKPVQTIGDLTLRAKLENAKRGIHTTAQCQAACRGALGGLADKLTDDNRARAFPQPDSQPEYEEF